MAEPGRMSRILLDRYELRDPVGVGGMGEVWLGWDRRLQRDVAVKLLLAQLSDEPAFRQRFEVEARAAAALEHPNVVRVFDVDEDDGALFIVMERLPGPSLDRRLAQGPMGEEEVLRVAHDMLSGLASAHAENLVHRDIKPGNLIRSAGGRWKVGDFGVAKDLASTANLTLVGVAVGTPAYLAPEQLDGRPATSATDLWAAGVVLREALTGRRPFDGNDPIEVAHAVKHTVVAPLATVRPDISPALAGAIDRSLSFDPRHRFTTATEMLAAIEGKTPVPVALLPVENVPAPPSSVSGEVTAIAPATASSLSGEVTAIAPSGPAGGEQPTVGTGPSAPDTSDGDRSSPVRMVAIAGIVVGSILLVFLLALLFGLLMDDDASDDGSPVPTTVATTVPVADGVTTTGGGDPAGTPGSTGTPDEAPPPDGEGLLPGDGPLDPGPTVTTEPKPDSTVAGSAPEITAPGPGDDTGPATTSPGDTAPGRATTPGGGTFDPQG